MVGITEFAAIASSLKSASDLTKAAIGLRDAAAMQSKIIELQSVILSAQSSALTAQSEYFSMLERIRELEKQLAHAEAWDSEKQKYILCEVSRGAFAFVLKTVTDSGEPPHWLCAGCYELSRKRYLQRGPRAAGPPIRDTYVCSTCNSAILVQHGVSPSSSVSTKAPSIGGPPCPLCAEPMKTVDVSPDPNFGDMGLQLHSYLCVCGHAESRQVDPNK